MSGLTITFDFEKASNIAENYGLAQWGRHWEKAAYLPGFKRSLLAQLAAICDANPVHFMEEIASDGPKNAGNFAQNALV